MSDPLPEREDWLDPDDVDEAEVPDISVVEVQVSLALSLQWSKLTAQVDESWLLSADDLAELEKDFM